MSFVSLSQWDAFVKQNPQTHILQTAQWGALKSEFGWEPYYLLNEYSGALLLVKNIFAGMKLAYIPKGPVGEHWLNLWQEVDTFCRNEHVVFLKVEPDYWENEQEIIQKELPSFHPNAPTIQPRRTITISLKGNETDWLGRMKQKTRYNIRLAEKKDITVIESSKVNTFLELLHATGKRDAFEIHADAYYQRAFDIFKSAGLCALLIATYAQKPLAGLMVFKFGKRAWYLYGASNDQERNRMPTYLLQWEAMRWAKAQGCEEYDLWGIPDAPEEVLEKDFNSRNDGLWGVYRFKRGFGGEIKRSVGAFDRIYNQPLYHAYRLYVNRGSTSS